MSSPVVRGETSELGGRSESRVRLATLFGMSLLVCGCAGLPAAPSTPPPPTSAQAGATTVVAVAAPSPPPISLPQFLGLDVAYGGVRVVGQRVRARLGTRFPALEPRAPVKSLTDPANTSETASPAVKAAAEAKAEQDEAPQKAKAIRYLATLGCGKCYPDTEDALLAALDDCNELIRYETVRGLRKSLGDPCNCCRENSCCSPRLTQKLYKLAYGKDDSGCFCESSARVRRNARLALSGCGGVQPEQMNAIPVEGPLHIDAIPVEGVPAEGIPLGLPTDAPETDLGDSTPKTNDQVSSISMSLPSMTLPSDEVAKMTPQRDRSENVVGQDTGETRSLAEMDGVGRFK